MIEIVIEFTIVIAIDIVIQDKRMSLKNDRRFADLFLKKLNFIIFEKLIYFLSSLRSCSLIPLKVVKMWIKNYFKICESAVKIIHTLALNRN